MKLTEYDMLGLSNRFYVVIDGMDLGSWKTCKGLNVSFEIEAIYSGGHYGGSTILPKQVKYSNVTLQRAMSPAQSQALRSWLSSAIIDDWYGGYDDHVGGTAEITVCDAHGKPVGSYTLRNVYPSKYSGPDLDGGTSAVALETLELVHEGFL